MASTAFSFTGERFLRAPFLANLGIFTKAPIHVCSETAVPKFPEVIDLTFWTLDVSLAMAHCLIGFRTATGEAAIARPSAVI